MRKRLEAAFDTFVDGSSKTDRDLAEWLNRSEVDIAVNLNGYSGLERTGLLRGVPALYRSTISAFRERWAPTTWTTSSPIDT